MSLKKFLNEKREEILDIAYRNGANNIKIFGSVVRAEDTEKSDVDFLVELQEGCTLFDLIKLKQELEEFLGKKVDVVTVNSVHHTMKDQIINEAVEV